jgi:hypothetical protein
VVSDTVNNNATTRQYQETLKFPSELVHSGLGMDWNQEGTFAQKRSPGSHSAYASFTPCKSAQKCNEALSRDLWPLDPFESAPMRATSSGMGYCILCAIQLRLEIKELAELLSGKAGSNSLPLKKLLCGFF